MKKALLFSEDFAGVCSLSHDGNPLCNCKPTALWLFQPGLLFHQALISISEKKINLSKKELSKKIADIGPKKGVEVGSGTVFINWFIFNMNVHIFAPFDVSQLFVRKDNDTFLETLWIYLYFRSFGTPLLLLVASAERS